MPVEHSQWDRWERTRSGGRDRYVWIYGVCAFGISLGVLGTIFAVISVTFSRHPVPAIALLPLALGPQAGYLWGRLMWQQTEAKYLAAQKEKEQKAALDALTREVLERRELPKEHHDMPQKTRITELDE